ncbi:MAG: transposase [Chloroflexi bacterium]|nr:transposase [Chloroflexota bacterium]
MAIITLRLTAVNSHPEDRPTHCHYCGHALLQKWGTVAKPIRDSQMKKVFVHRYFCIYCERTFRHYTSGIERADQSLRLQQLAALCWQFGFSTRHVSGLFGAFGISLAHMSVWRDVQKQAAALGQKPPRPPMRVLGLDGVYGRVAGQPYAATVAVDVGNDQLISLAAIDEHSIEQVVEWLKPIVAELGIEVLVSDDLAEAAQVAEQLGLHHQVCQFHLIRWVERAVRELRGEIQIEWHAALERIRQLVKELPATGQTELFALYEQLPVERKRRGARASPMYRLRQLVLRLSEHWNKYRLYQERADVPRTNNRTEQAIGRWRTRSRSVRGFKSAGGLQSAFWVCANGSI